MVRIAARVYVCVCASSEGATDQPQTCLCSGGCVCSMAKATTKANKYAPVGPYESPCECVHSHQSGLICTQRRQQWWRTRMMAAAVAYTHTHTQRLGCEARARTHTHIQCKPDARARTRTQRPDVLVRRQPEKGDAAVGWGVLLIDERQRHFRAAGWCDNARTCLTNSDTLLLDCAGAHDGAASTCSDVGHIVLSRKYMCEMSSAARMLRLTMTTTAT